MRFIWIVWLVGLGCYLHLTRADYCRHYPGDISFSYSVTQDEDYWFQNYKNAYQSKKGNNGVTTIYRRRTIITHGRRPGGPVGTNMNNMPFVEQVQQQQQVQQAMPVPNIAENGTNPESQESVALPIWKITIPRQSSRAILVHVENAQALDHFELNKTHFDNVNLTAYSNPTRTSMSSSVSTPSVATRQIDITDQSIIPEAWYVICLSVNIVQRGKPATCDHCTILQARTDSARQQCLDFGWVPGTVKNDTAELQYAATDFPFPWATIKTKVWTKYTHPKCHGKLDHVVFESKDYAYPEHFTYVTVQNLLATQSYVVQVDLELPWKEQPKDILPRPLVIQDYLHGDTLSTVLEKCEDYRREEDL